MRFQQERDYAWNETDADGVGRQQKVQGLNTLDVYKRQMLPINFDGSKMSLMTGDKLPETTMKVFSLSYTLAPMKE